ncbi:MAG TPA: DUF4097 family beta strand repeat-containing protein [Thermoanaerobaculia bacterium]|jgi:hypothetical protein|nr:DUF4097 family beta strand repeat-containing protein [Thermoanaerobaculia bacterium]
MRRTISTILPVAALLVGASLPAFGQGQTRAFRQAFPVQGANVVRLANLAGRIELVRIQGNQVLVDATVHAQGESGNETQKLLQNMKWVKAEDRHGNEEWALSYPVKDYRGFAYPRPGSKKQEESWFLSWLASKGAMTSTQYRGERVRVYNERSSSAPMLYADLRIGLPVGSNVVVRNIVGDVRGGQLEGTLKVDTGSGKVEVAAYDGNLVVDTGSGDVVLGSARGETSVDTGSGDVVVRRLVGNGKMDTGSGDVTVENVSAGRLYVDTGSGDVIVRGGTASRVIADTGSGNVHVMGVELEELEADTGSGDVVILSSLAQAKRISADTGSGDVEIHAGPNAAFDIESDQGSGDLEVGYADAQLRKDGKKVVGARRGNGQTVIRVETGSGDCVISPKQGA